MTPSNRAPVGLANLMSILSDGMASIKCKFKDVVSVGTDDNWRVPQVEAVKSSPF